MIISVTIQEVSGTYLIELNDGSQAPPYRIENMTKNKIAISQAKNSKQGDYDLICPYQIINYALSHPLDDKILKISIKSKDLSDRYGVFNNQIASISLDSFSNNEIIEAYDKRDKVMYIINIRRERTMKVIRIQAKSEFEIEHQNNNDETAQRELSIEVKCPELGISFINSLSAEELVYLNIREIGIFFEKTKAFKKFKINILDIQIDNQLEINPENCVILKKDGGKNFYIFSLDYWQINNEGFEHIIHFKEFDLRLYYLKLFLESSFCLEFYLYLQKIMTTLSPLFIRDDNIDSPVKLETIKSDIQGELEKPKQIIYFEYLYIDNINIKFGFESKPGFLNQAQLDDTSKVLLVTLMNMKKVTLDFQAYVLNHTSQFMPVFISNIKSHYISELYSQKQLINILMSIGIFGTLRETLSSLSTAFGILTRNPRRNENFIIGLGENIQNSTRYIIYSVSNVLKGVLDSVGQIEAYVYLFGQKVFRTLLRKDQTIVYNIEDKNMDENDIKSEFLYNINSLAASLDFQNKIWLGIVINEIIRIRKNDEFLQGNNIENMSQHDQNEDNKDLDQYGGKYIILLISYRNQNSS